MMLSSRRVVRRALAVLLLTAVASVFPAGVAAAHDQLVDSSPASGERLDAAPTEVRLTFAGDLMELGSTVVVADAAGQDWAGSTPVLDGPALTVPLAPDLPDGAYTVRWRVVSADGHPISGSVPFQVGDATSPDATVTPDAAASPSADPTGRPVADATDGESPRTEDATTTGPRRIVLVAVGGAALATAVYAVVLVTRRRARDRQP